VHDADGDLDAGGDGADGFPALAAGEDGGALVVVDDGAPAAGAALAPGRLEAALRLADDVAAPVLGQGEGQVEDQQVRPEYGRNGPRTLGEARYAERRPVGGFRGG
jgi:hypothetical protein